MTRNIFIPELLCGIDEELIAESELWIRGKKKPAKKRRFGTLLIAAALLIMTVAAIGIHYLSDGFILPPDSTSDITSETPPESFFVIENGVLISYSGTDTEVTVPEGVTSLSAGAFEGNSTMMVLTLSSTVSVIEDGCLDACEALEEVRVAEGGVIGSSDGLVISADGKSIIYVNKSEVAENLVIPEGVETLNASFYECNTIRNLTLPLSLSEIPKKAFAYCESLESISLGGVRTIGEDAFYACKNLVTADLGETRLIRDSAFAYCGSLRDVTMTYVVTVGERAFSSCNIEYLDFGKRLTSIAQNAFSGCSKLAEIVLPDTLQYIQAGAFRSCGIKKVNYKGSYEEWESKRSQFIGLTALKGYELICLDEEPIYVATNQQFISNGDGTCRVEASRNKEESGVIKIPAVSPEGDTVVSVSGFAGCDNMTAIILPDTVTTITGAAFSGCDNLERVEAPGVISLGSRAFASCRSLTEVILNPALAEIPESAFTGCTSLVSLPLHEGLQKIGESAFTKVGATHIVFPSTLTEVGISAFESCAELVSVDMSKSAVKLLDRNTFASCAKLKDVVFPSVLEEISVMVFSQCTSLAEVTLPDGLRKIGDQAFSYTSLTSIVIPDSVTTLKCAFRFCDSFRSLTLGKGIKVFEALGNCIAIESYVIPDTVTSIGVDAFSGCINLRDVTIPDTVTAIGDSAFIGCTNLGSIVIPDSVKTIGNSAFSECSSLANVKMSSNLTSLEIAAFKYCVSLRSIELPDTLRIIGGICFQNCIALEEITLPKKADEIGQFAFENCTALKSVIIPEGVRSLGEGVFVACTSLKSVLFPSTLTSIGERCFEGCSSIESLTFPKKLTVINSVAFRYCTSLGSVEFNNGLKVIEGYSFADCPAITSLRIPATVESINSAFINCAAIKTLTFAEGAVSVLSADAFSGCTAIETIVFEDPSKLCLNFQSFMDFTSLKKVVIEKGTLHVPENCFRGCSSLSEIDFSKISFIEDGAFAGCTSLPSVIEISSLVPVIGANAFNGCTSIEKVVCSPYIRIFEDGVFSGCTALREISIGLATTVGNGVFKNCTALEKITYPGTEAEYAKLVLIGNGNEPFTQISASCLDNLELPKGYRMNRKDVAFKSEAAPGYVLLDPLNLRFETDEKVNIYSNTEGYLVAENDDYCLVIIYAFYYLIDKTEVVDITQ